MISRNAVVQVKRQLTPKASIVTKEVFKKNHPVRFQYKLQAYYPL